MRIDGQIKKITSTVDKEGEIKIQIVLEYKATEVGKNRVAELIRLQDKDVSCEIKAEQRELPLKPVAENKQAV
jgi:hypothetical protein